MDSIDFEAAIEKTTSYNRHLLLGNGFSIACCPATFDYTSLFEKANFNDKKHLEKIASEVASKDFELAMGKLLDASTIVTHYNNGSKLASDIKADAKDMKEILIKTIAMAHPEKSTSISNMKYRSCRKFLSHFIGPETEGNVYTVNYDLLLYWATLRHQSDDEPTGLQFGDGFGPDNGGHSMWSENNPPCEQRMFFLHGAFHLYMDSDRLMKYTYWENEVPLIQQTRSALEKGGFPLFISEGRSRKKFEEIMRYDYLRNAYNSFGESMRDKRNCLFIYGLSLSEESDNHIFEMIKIGNVPKVYLGIYGDKSTGENMQTIQTAQSWITYREINELPKLEVVLFDATADTVWGH